MGLLAKLKLRGSIIESMIGLLIVLFSLTAAFSIVLKVSQNQSIKQHTRARLLADKSIHKICSETRFLSEEESVEGLTIEKKIVWYNQEQHLLEIEVKVYDNRERLLAFRRKIIISNDQDILHEP